MSKRCERHCWHLVSSTTDGMAQKGFDTMRCCWCGVSGRRDWFYKHDPDHGQYADDTIRVEQMTQVDRFVPR